MAAFRSSLVYIPIFDYATNQKFEKKEFSVAEREEYLQHVAGAARYFLTNGTHDKKDDTCFYNKSFFFGGCLYGSKATGPISMKELAETFLQDYKKFKENAVPRTRSPPSSRSFKRIKRTCKWKPAARMSCRSTTQDDEAEENVE